MAIEGTMDALKKVLIETYALYLKTQNYHWNVTGANFKSLHELFEEHYNDFAGAIDSIAERMRMLGGYPNLNFAEMAKSTKVGDSKQSIEANEMIRDLVAGHKILIDAIKEGLPVEANDGDEVSISLFVDRLSFHEKAIWMLESSIG